MVVPLICKLVANNVSVTVTFPLAKPSTKLKFLPEILKLPLNELSPPTYKRLFSEASSDTNNFCKTFMSFVMRTLPRIPTSPFNDASLAIVTFLFSETSPPTTTLLLKDASPETNNLRFNEAS